MTRTDITQGQLSEGLAAGGRSGPATSGAGNAARILIVDDQQANLDLLGDLLAGWGYTDVVATTDSAETVALCRGHDPNVLLLDLHMPAPDGFEVLAQLAPWTRRGMRLPVLVLTADTTDEAKARALAAGARDFLTKPFSPVETRLRVANLIEANLLQRAQETQNDLLEAQVRERTRALDRARIETLDRLARAGEFRDDNTHEHAQRVGRTAALLAAGIGLAAAAQDEIRLAAPLHDVGKLAIPDAILLKPGRLEPEEFEVVKTHTRVGHELLAGSGASVLDASAEIALSHHERWDGSGYPLGLRAEAIPVAGRLVAVADVFDALTHERPYKDAWPLERAVAEIESQAGTQFCPTVVDAFRRLDHDALMGGFVDAATRAA